MKKTFIFIGFWPDYESLFIENARSDDYNIIIENPKEIIARFFPPKWIPKPLRTWVEKRIFKNLLKKYQKDIFILHETRTLIEALRDTNMKVEAHILMRNILDPNSKTGRCVLNLSILGYPIWSFDLADCAKYDFLSYKQFISECPGIKETPIQYDLTFVGRNKGREVILNRIAKIAREQNLTTLFDIRSDGKNKKSTTYKGNISYLDYLHTLCSGYCIVDIVQENQSGLTMRPLEALIYQRKLLTNNASILDEDFYHPNNIFYINDMYELQDEKLLAFLQIESSPIEINIVQNYTLKNLLHKILLSPNHS